LLGQKNYECLYSYCQGVSGGATADVGDRTVVVWLDGVEKVVFSTTLTDAP
jgi:hypothetical protein